VHNSRWSDEETSIYLLARGQRSRYIRGSSFGYIFRFAMVSSLSSGRRGSGLLPVNIASPIPKLTFKVTCEFVPICLSCVASIVVYVGCCLDVLAGVLIFIFACSEAVWS